MLLVAQRVVSPERIQGINAYRYRHGDAPWPDDARPLLDDAAATLERTSVQLRPGGNRILSYLDIVAPDAASLDSVAGSVATFARGPAPAEPKSERSRDVRPVDDWRQKTDSDRKPANGSPDGRAYGDAARNSRGADPGGRRRGPGGNGRDRRSGEQDRNSRGNSRSQRSAPRPSPTGAALAKTADR